MRRIGGCITPIYFRFFNLIVNSKCDIMEFRNSLSLKKIREIDLVDHLQKLGHQPTKIRLFDYWYLSPLRVEKTASFKVNRKLNRWYDHGIGEGGNLIDFALRYYNCTIPELLYKLKNEGIIQPSPDSSFSSDAEKKESRITIIQERPLYNFSLQRYLLQRRIPIDLADTFCKEIVYRTNDKEYSAIGFKNDSGGYELRSPFFKGSSTPKDITTIQNNRDQTSVFEGFFDFLSFLAINNKVLQTQQNFVILNSLSLFEKARPFLEVHRQIHLYLDQDKAGQNYSRYALSLSQKYHDKSGLYCNYKDLNDWIVNFGKTQKQGLKL